MDKNLEKMKKLIEEKKNKGKNTKNNDKAKKNMGIVSKGKSSHNGRGFFD